MTIKLTPRKEPRQGRAKATVEAILEAVSRLTDEHGLEAWTTNQVAELAGVSVGSLYQYFPNKESLLTAWLVQRREERLSALADAVTEHLNDADRLARALARALCAGDLRGDRALRDHLESAGVGRKLAPQTRRTASLFTQLLARARDKPSAPDRLGLFLTLALESSLHTVARDHPDWLQDPAFEADLAWFLRRALA